MNSERPAETNNVYNFPKGPRTEVGQWMLYCGALFGGVGVVALYKLRTNHKQMMTLLKIADKAIDKADSLKRVQDVMEATVESIK